MELEYFLAKEIDKLSKAMEQLGTLNIVDNNSLMMKKRMQGKLNDGYSIIVDVKMDLEKIINKFKE